MSIALKLKEGYKRNKGPYIIFPLAGILILGILLYVILNLSGYFDEAPNKSLSTIKLPDPLEAKQKSKRDLQRNIDTKRIVTNREFKSTLNADLEEEFIDPETKTKGENNLKFLGSSSQENGLSKDVYSRKNIGNRHEDIGESLEKINTSRDSALKEKIDKEQMQRKLEQLEENLREMKTAQNIANVNRKTQDKINAISSNGQINADSTKIANVNRNLDSKESYKPTYGNGYVHSTSFNDSEVIEKGRGYVISTTRKSSITTKKLSTIAAIIDHDHTLYAGSLLQIRILQPINFHGITIPINHHIYGIARFAKERLYVDFSSIELDSSIIPFKAKVYDYDGLLGLDAPGTKDADIAKGSSAQAVQGTAINTESTGAGVVESAKISGTSAAVEAVKNIATLKIIEPRVTIKAGHKLFLVIDN